MKLQKESERTREREMRIACPRVQYSRLRRIFAHHQSRPANTVAYNNNIIYIIRNRIRDQVTDEPSIVNWNNFDSR